MSINNLSTALGEPKSSQLASVMRQTDSIEVEAKEPAKAEAIKFSQGETQDKAQHKAEALRSGADSNGKVNSEVNGEITEQGAAQAANKTQQGETLTRSLQQVSDSSAQLSSLQIRKLEFSASEEAGQVVVKVIDKENDDVIRQIPSEEFIRVAQKISDLSQELDSAQGLLFESKV